MRDRWLILAVLTFARTAMGFQFQSVAAVSPFLLDHFQMSYAALSSGTQHGPPIGVQK
jgi:hypothetical protein